MRLTGLGFVASALVLGAIAASACVNSDVPAIASDDAGATSDATTTTGGGDDASTTTQDAGPTCRVDQLVCDGACVDVGPQHCGGCTTVCPSSTPLCSSGSGTPACVASCDPGKTQCGSQCVDTATNPSNCGGCGTKCPTPLNGVATCANSTCDFTCKTGFHPCGATCAADDDVMHCGATCKVCTAPSGGTAVCSGGACSFTCSSGTACPTQNVCANLNTDVNNCGTCGKACAVATSCTTGACLVKYGNYTPYGGHAASSARYFSATRIDTPIAITVTKLGMYAPYYDSGTGQYSVWLGLYANSGGHPGALLASAKVLVTGTGASELAITPTTIAAGTYFVGATQNNWAYYGMDTSSGNYEFYDNGSTYYNDTAAPNPAPATQTLSGSMNFYLIGKE